MDIPLELSLSQRFRLSEAERKRQEGKEANGNPKTHDFLSLDFPPLRTATLPPTDGWIVCYFIQFQRLSISLNRQHFFACRMGVDSQRVEFFEYFSSSSHKKNVRTLKSEPQSSYQRMLCRLPASSV